MSKKKLISIAIPCFNEQENIALIYKKIKKITQKLNYNFEIIFVDNGSFDKTRQIIKKLNKKDKIVKGLGLSRNFGPESSSWAGVEWARGDAVITIECDLQSPPELIPQLITKWEAGFDSVVAVYDKIEDYFWMVWIRKFYYWIMGKISQIEIPANATGFGLIDRKVVEALKKIPEKHRFYRGLKAWVGFKSIKINYQRKKRQAGTSSYNLINYFKHAERGVFGFSYLLLDFLFYGSLMILAGNLFLLSMLLFSSLINNYFNFWTWTFLIVSLIFNIQFLSIGIIGKYIQVISEESKARPVYIVEEYIK